MEKQIENNRQIERKRRLDILAKVCKGTDYNRDKIIAEYCYLWGASLTAMKEYMKILEDSGRIQKAKPKDDKSDSNKDLANMINSFNNIRGYV